MPQSNGLAETAVGQVKLHLSKLGKLIDPKFQDLLYCLKNTPASVAGAGSAFIKFFGRKGRSDLPSFLRKFSYEQIRLMKLA